MKITNGTAHGVVPSVVIMLTWQLEAAGLAIIDISDPANPGTPVYQGTKLEVLRGVAVSGNYAYVADRSLRSGNQRHFRSRQAQALLSYRATNANMGTALGVAVSGNYAYVAASFASGIGNRRYFRSNESRHT